MKKIFLLLISILLCGTTLFAQSTTTKSEALVDAQWIKNHIDDPALLVLDIRNTDAYQEGHIQGAVFTDYSRWRVNKNGLPGFLPDKTYIQDLIQETGIQENSKIVIVSGVNDQFDFGRAARIYWTLKVAGLDSLSILDGGIDAWVRAGYELSTEPTTPTPSNYVVQAYDRSLIETEDTVKQAIKSNTNNYLFLDARPKKQYEGYAKHKLAKITGTIKGAVNVSQFDFINANGTIKAKQELQAILDAADVDTSKQIITFCNTGHWAATDWFVVSEILNYNASLYDGSMVEWSRNSKKLLDNTRTAKELKRKN